MNNQKHLYTICYTKNKGKLKYESVTASSEEEAEKEFYKKKNLPPPRHDIDKLLIETFTPYQVLSITKV